MKRKEWSSKNYIIKMFESSLNRIFKFINIRVLKSKNINELQNTLNQIPLNPFFNKLVDRKVNFIMEKVAKSNAKSWREASNSYIKGKKIREDLIKNISNNQIKGTIEEQVRKNANYIKTVPKRMTEYVTKFVSKQQIKGIRAEEITEMLKEKIPSLSKVQAKRIARTEVSKSQMALTQARSQKIGVNWYVWRSSKDARTRKAHKKMEGVLINYNIPPSPEVLVGEKSEGNYNAGEIYNCRCYAEPIIRIDFLKFPVKVFYGNQVKRMGKEEFLKISNF